MPAFAFVSLHEYFAELANLNPSLLTDAAEEAIIFNLLIPRLASASIAFHVAGANLDPTIVSKTDWAVSGCCQPRCCVAF